MQKWWFKEVIGMNKTMFIDMLIEYRFLDSIWKNVEKYIIENIVSDEDIIKLLSLYFVSTHHLQDRKVLSYYL